MGWGQRAVRLFSAGIVRREAEGRRDDRELLAIGPSDPDPEGST
jgi:hypothetical protein